MKYGNRLVFMRDLEKYQEDLSYTKGEKTLTHGCTHLVKAAYDFLLKRL